MTVSFLKTKDQKRTEPFDLPEQAGRAGRREDPQRTVAKVENLFQQDYEGVRYYYHAQWYTNIAYFVGLQYIIYNETTHRFLEPKDPPWRVRLVANRIQPAIRQLLAKMTHQRVALDVLPNSSDADDVSAARIGKRVLDYYYRKQRMDEKREELAMWALTCGTAFLRPFWNTSREIAGTVRLPRTDPRTGELATDDRGDRIYYDCPLGDTDSEVIDPFSVILDNDTGSWDRMKWAMIAKLRHLDYIRERWPEMGDQVRPEEHANVYNYYESRLRNLLTTFNFTSFHGVSQSPTSAIVKEYFERPSDRFPKGRKIVVANGILLEDGELPYDHQELPLIPVYDIKVPGRIWGQSVIENLIPLQKEYNKSRSQVIENRNQMSKPKWVIAKGHGIHEDSITSEPGEVIEYAWQPGMPPPSPVSPSPLPSYVSESENRTLQDFMEQAGLHEVSRAQAPTGVTSGVAINFLLEQDETRLGPVIRGIEIALEKWGQQTLSIVGQFVRENRMAKIIGKHNQIEIMRFKGKDLRGNYDAHVQAGSALPQSKVAKQELILRLWQLQVIKDPNEILRRLELGDVENLFLEQSLDKRQAQRENESLSRGEWVDVEEWHEHLGHMDAHNAFRKTEEYEHVSEEAKVFFEAHVAAHEYALIQKTQKMQGIQAGLLGSARANVAAAGLPTGEEAPEEGTAAEGPGPEAAPTGRQELGVEGGAPPGGGQPAMMRAP